MALWQEWSKGWLKEGHYISFIVENVQYFEHIIAKDWAHWDYPWHETVTALSVSGPHTPAAFELTRGWDKNTGSNRLWQFIFGIKGQAYIYVELPTDTHRHGIPKAMKPSSDFREVSHFQEYMSPYFEPSFITEHFLMRPVCDRITLEVHNPNSIDLTDLRLNFMINKVVTQRIGTVSNGTLYPTQDRFRDLLGKMYNHQVPVRPITIEPVRAPAEAPAGE
ncbi:MAG: hypothetical protein KKB59_18630 [Spirochaetes bacterium]|nr:hypothetical protein [Spirochaetota bacterium]